MKKLIKIFTLTIFLLLIQNVSMLGQYIPRVLDPDNQEIKVFAERISKNGWVYFKPVSNIKHDELFTTNKSAFGLSNDDEMRFKKVQIDDGKGNVTYRYQ